MRPTIPMLNANIAALEAANDELREENKRLRTQLADLQDSARAELRDRVDIHVATMRQRRCDELNMHGVPCKIHNGLIVHSATYAVLEKPGEFLPR